MLHWTQKVEARATLAKALRAKPDRMTAAGLRDEDLAVIETQGVLAREADVEQQAQLNEARLDMKQQAELSSALFDRDRQVRNRLPAVVGDLRRAGEARQADFFQTLSFARYRVRELKQDPPPETLTDSEVEAIQTAERVERDDVSTRAAGIAAFATIVLGDDRAPVLAAFEARGLDRTFFEGLVADGRQLAEAGENRMRGAEATQRERDAVAAQSARWSEVRRMVADAVAGDVDLEHLFAGC